MKVAIAQIQSAHDPEENLRKSRNLVQEASEKGCQLIVFPEYQLHMPDYNDRESTRRILPQAGKALESLVRESRIPAIFNYPEEHDEDIYNTSVFVSGNAPVSRYRKTHLFNAFSYREENIYRPGDSLPATVELPGIRASFMICYDLRFTEPARLLALSGTDLLVYQAGWFAGERKEDHWRTLLRTRAIENGYYVAGSAQTGNLFTGHSMIVGPNGDVLVEMGKEEGICVAEISHDMVEKYRTESGVISGRREDLYTLRSGKEEN